MPRRRRPRNVPDEGPDFIYDLVETLKGTQPIDARRVYLFGHSAGAGHALALGLMESEFPLPVVRATRDALNSQGFDAQLTELTNHTHWYYDRAAEINIKVWAFLQKARLPGEPKYQRYQIAR